MAHLTIAASERAFQALFSVLRDNFRLVKSGSIDLGTVTATYALNARLQGGTLELRADNTVHISELDIKWDQLDLTLRFEWPIDPCIGGFCIRLPVVGCIWVPPYCLFNGMRDIEVTLPLGGMLTSELSVIGSLSTAYERNPNRPAGMNDWDAQDATPSLASHWRLFIEPQLVSIDVFDLADSVGDVMQSAVDAEIDKRLSILPLAFRAPIKSALGSVIDVIRKLLDVEDDIKEQIAEILGTSLDLLDVITTAVGQYLAKQAPLQLFEDPYPILGPTSKPPDSSGPPNLVPVKVPIRHLKVYNDDREMVLQANIG